MAQKLDKKTRIKAWILLAVVLIAMCIPMRQGLKDGGTIYYTAILYRVTMRHAETIEDHRSGLRTGTEVRVLFWEVYDDTVFIPDEIESVISPAG